MSTNEHIELQTQVTEATPAEVSEPEGPPAGYVLVAMHGDCWPLSPVPSAPGLAERQGPNVLMYMGVGLFLVAVISFFTGHSTIGIALSVMAVTTEVVAAGLARLELFQLEALKLGFLATFHTSGRADPDG